MANREASSSSARCWEVNMTAVCLWYLPVHRANLSLIFYTLIKSIFKLLTTRNRQFLQAFISNTFPVELVLQSVKILCGNIKLQVIHSEMETEQTVIPAQTTGYLWVTNMETKLEDEHEMKVNFHLNIQCFYYSIETDQ
ncbi:uncharacterized protein LOC134186252 [Corticium candelabrum]|uniref:uncharacterized protein LOC134186252 n=1 Tax=Corticium candelabrum TaxID=121492 RepID=UPI002E26A6CE|nr:uncharacterized protein LOC134186252 [Corticium candelabrum]